jgi:hypothetical protein
MQAIKKFFSLIWRGWKKFAHILGIINTRILLTVSYFVIFAIASLFTALGRKDLLDRKMTRASTYYRGHEPIHATVESTRRQF